MIWHTTVEWIVKALDHSREIFYFILLPVILHVGNMKLANRYSSLIGCAPESEYCRAYKELFGHRLMFLAVFVGFIQPLRLAWEHNFRKELTVSNAVIFLLLVIFFLVLCQFALIGLRKLMKSGRTSNDFLVRWSIKSLNLLGTMLLVMSLYYLIQVIAK